MKLNEFEGKTILITGATGLIGKAVTAALLRHNEAAATPVHVIAVVRSREKAERVFAGLPTQQLELLVSDVCSIKPENMGVDYIIHGASRTASKDFVSEPVETIMTALNGTRQLLEFARVNPVKGFVYLSSMEVYGTPETDEKINEIHGTNLDTMKVRSCYPVSKRMCESLCASYAAEYSVPAMAVRLTQTFGPGVNYDDGRVFAEFARCAIEKRDIVLNTTGETKRCYLYTEDAVDAILTVLISGQSGEAYNAANEKTYCSIYEMACMVAEKCGNNEISVVINAKEDISKFGYAPTLKMNLDTSKLQKLGWCAKVNLQQMFENMISDMRRK
jgi:nucleoside-diphosphate-sugar epimerase